MQKRLFGEMPGAKVVSILLTSLEFIAKCLTLATKNEQYGTDNRVCPQFQ